MPEKSLANLIEDSIENQDLHLPVFNPVATKVQELINSDDYNGDDLAAILEQDQALAAHILKISNSAFYAGLNPVKTVKEAAFRLGANSLNSVVMAVTQKQMYKTRVVQFKTWVQQLWTHALGVAVAAKWLSENMGFNSLAEEAFMAGLLHDIGKLLHLRIIDELMVKQSLKGRISINLVKEIMTDLHTEHGKRYLEKLNMPKTYPVVAGQHHDPQVKGEHIILNLVRLANLSCHKLGIGMVKNPDIMLSTTPEAINLMAKDIILAELQVNLEEYIQSMNNLV